MAQITALRPGDRLPETKNVSITYSWPDQYVITYHDADDLTVILHATHVAVREAIAQLSDAD